MNYYQILGVDIDANHAEINRAYRKLSLKYQPDKNLYEDGYYEKKYKQVQDAYAVLGDLEKKEQYDIKCGFKNMIESLEFNKDGKDGDNFSQQNSIEHHELPLHKKNTKRLKNKQLLLMVLAVLFLGYLYNYIKISRFKGLEDSKLEESQEITSPKVNNSNDNMNKTLPDKVKSTINSNDKGTDKSVFSDDDIKDTKVVNLEDKQSKVNLKKASNKEVNVINSNDQSNNKSPIITNTTLQEQDLPPTILEKNSIEESEIKNKNRFFSIGSSMKDVEEIQGKPISTNYYDGKEIWFYGEHRVVFKNGIVIQYVDPYNQLKIKK